MTSDQTNLALFTGPIHVHIQRQLKRKESKRQVYIIRVCGWTPQIFDCAIKISYSTDYTKFVEPALWSISCPRGPPTEYKHSNTPDSNRPILSFIFENVHFFHAAQLGLDVCPKWIKFLHISLNIAYSGCIPSSFRLSFTHSPMIII